MTLARVRRKHCVVQQGRVNHPFSFLCLRVSLRRQTTPMLFGGTVGRHHLADQSFKIGFCPYPDFYQPGGSVATGRGTQPRRRAS